MDAKTVTQVAPELDYTRDPDIVHLPPVLNAAGQQKFEILGPGFGTVFRTCHYEFRASGVSNGPVFGTAFRSQKWTPKCNQILSPRFPAARSPNSIQTFRPKSSRTTTRRGRGKNHSRRWHATPPFAHGAPGRLGTLHTRRAPKPVLQLYIHGQPDAPQTRPKLIRALAWKGDMDCGDCGCKQSQTPFI